MKRQARGCTDGTSSCDRIISSNYHADDSSLQHLSEEEKASLTFLEELIMSTVTEDGDLSCHAAQSSENTISKKNQVTTREVHQEKSSCTGSLPDLSAEEMACLKFLEETINSLEDGELSTYNAESAPESSYTTHGDRMNSKKKQNVSKGRCCKPNPPLVAPKPRMIPSHIASLNPKGTSISSLFFNNTFDLDSDTNFSTMVNRIRQHGGVVVSTVA